MHLKMPRNLTYGESAFILFYFLQKAYIMPINLYDSKSAGAESYRLLAEEVANFGMEEEEE